MKYKWLVVSYLFHSSFAPFQSHAARSTLQRGGGKSLSNIFFLFSTSLCNDNINIFCHLRKVMLPSALMEKTFKPLFTKSYNSPVACVLRPFFFFFKPLAGFLQSWKSCISHGIWMFQWLSLWMSGSIRQRLSLIQQRVIVLSCCIIVKWIKYIF